jgi:hypothetical protein
VDVVYEFVDPTDVNAAEVATGVAAVERIAPRPDEVSLVITGDFVASNRLRLTGIEAEAYDMSRTFGVAAARTLPQLDGTVDIVVAAPLLHSNAADTGLNRVVMHEAYHAAIYQRHEELGTIRVRHSIPGMTHRGYFSSVAGMVADEYRVERALCDEGDWPHHGYHSELPETLETFRNDLYDACLLRYPNESIERTSKSVLTSFGHIATLGGYLAAEALASGGERAPNVRLALWHRFVGGAWDPFVQTLDQMPSAPSATPPADLDAMTFLLIGPLDGWLRQVGFEIRDEGEGLYFDVLRLPHV